MRLLFAIKRLAGAVGGAERVLCTLCNELAKRGHSVTLLTFDEPHSKPFYFLSDGVKRLDLAVGDSARPARLRESCERIVKLRSEILNHNPDVVVGFMHSIFVPLSVALAVTGIPVIGSEHIVPDHYRTRPIQYGLLKLTAPLLKRITVLSESIRATYPKALRKRMSVIANPLMQPGGCVDKPIHASNRQLLSVGRLDPQKDQCTLIEAFSMLASDFPHWSLSIIGEGPLRGQLESLIKRYELQSRVSLPGVVRNIDSAYVDADLFVLPSRYEAFGLVTAEAMSHGLAAVGFEDCPGTNELIQHEETGLLVSPSPNRACKLAEALCTLMGDDERRCELGDNGRRYIENHFSTELVIDQWEDLLRTVVEAR